MVTTGKSVRQGMKSLPQTSDHRQVGETGEAAKVYSFPFGCGANVLELTVVVFAYASSVYNSPSYTP